MKKLIWNILTVVAVLLGILAAYLTIMPEKEIADAENNPMTFETEAVEVSPVLSLDGAEITIGESKVQALLDAGFSLRFEKDGKLYKVNVTDANAEAKNQYHVLLYKNEQPAGELTYTNYADEKQTAGSCIADALSVDFTEAGAGDVKALLDGTAFSGLSADQIPDKFPGFEKTEAAEPTYRRSLNTESGSVIAIFHTGGTEGKTITKFEIRRYAQ